MLCVCLDPRLDHRGLRWRQRTLDLPPETPIRSALLFRDARLKCTAITFEITPLSLGGLEDWQRCPVVDPHRTYFYLFPRGHTHKHNERVRAVLSGRPIDTNSSSLDRDIASHGLQSN